MLTPVVTILICANAAIYLASQQLQFFAQLYPLLVLRPALIPIEPWTLITYTFLHSNFMHIFFNMLTLFFFGPRVEAQLGGTKFTGLYFVSGIVGGLLSWVFTPYTAIIGASGAVFGVMYAYARYWPRDRILVFFLPLEARFAVLVMAGLDLWSGFSGSDLVAHFAHLGGVAGAVVYVWAIDRNPRKIKFEQQLRTPRVSRSDLARWSKIRRDELHSVNRDELDRIMEKIEHEGITSVTSQERVFLDNFSERYGS
jgi:membrane associated rhomboid family serine protease